MYPLSITYRKIGLKQDTLDEIRSCKFGIPREKSISAFVDTPRVCTHQRT